MDLARCGVAVVVVKGDVDRSDGGKDATRFGNWSCL